MRRRRPELIDHAGGFTAEDAVVVARALARAGAVAEVNFASFWHLGHDEGLVPAAREGFGLLREAGVRFSLGSDFHGVRGLPVSYDPARALEAFGVGAGDVRLPRPFEDVRVSEAGAGGPDGTGGGG